MMLLRREFIAVATAILGSLIASVSSLVISDDRARSLDITPVLGRGYSVMTNSFQSTCVNVVETTIPSFNYDCKC
jgi:hypothetical protein